MRELRTFELDQPGQPVSWCARQGQSVAVLEGLLWLTIENQLADIWLQAGAVYALPEGARVWMSGEAGPVRFVLSETSASLSLRRLFALARALLRMAGRAMHTDAYGASPRASC
ncbi:DUF2917 domain-containing protein [Cupriavidus sp. Marseille-Q8015]